MNRFQPIYDIAEICSGKGVVNAVLCPGSRCAPLVMAFARHEKIKTRTFSDERSAGFVALGLSQQSKQPAVVVCTSGTAAYNLSPAVAEAFFSETPLLVLTADRPAEWIAQHDGQTIYQADIFGKHVKKSFQLPQEYDHPDNLWAINRIVNEAINLAKQEPCGPVHINAPFREPLYPSSNEDVTFTKSVRILEEEINETIISDDAKLNIQIGFKSYHHVLIVAGQQDYNPELIKTLNEFFSKHNIPIVADITANVHPIEKLVAHPDLFLGQASEEVKKSLQPDLLITFGKSVLSKNLKVFLRKYSPKAHWHIQQAGPVVDVFQNLTKVIRSTPQKFFKTVSQFSRTEGFENQKQNNYNKLWEIEERRAQRCITEFFPHKDFAELELVREILLALPANCNLHLANSMSVRYANFIGLTAAQSGIHVYSNRGTSGIDGCTSTAIGHCLADNKRPNILITGDLAFFYDRNAFWNNYPTPNLRIALLNNHGGLIFKIIDGPGTLPETDEYFVTTQKLNAKSLCEEFGISHLALDLKRKLKNLLKDFYDFDGATKILELESSSSINKTIFDNFKLKIKKAYDL